MTVFDWILLALGVPWFLLVAASFTYVVLHVPNNKWSVDYKLFLPLIPLLWFAYRQWG